MILLPIFTLIAYVQGRFPLLEVPSLVLLFSLLSFCEQVCLAGSSGTPGAWRTPVSQSQSSLESSRLPINDCAVVSLLGVSELAVSYLKFPWQNVICYCIETYPRVQVRTRVRRRMGWLLLSVGSLVKYLRACPCLLVIEWSW